MLTRRNLRNCVIEENSNVRLREIDKFSTKCELDKKETQFVNSSLSEDCKSDRKNVMSLRSSALKDSNNKPVTKSSFKTVKNKYKNSCNKVSAKSPKKENVHKRSHRRELIIQSSKRKLSVLKENNFSVKSKGPVISVKKTLRNMKNVDKKDIKSNEWNKLNGKMKSYVVSFNHHPEKYANHENLHFKTKDCKTERNTTKHVTNIPIWKRKMNLNGFECFKKQNSKVDVYDIDQDEELMASEIVKKKKTHSRKKVKNVIRKKGILSIKNQKCKTKYPSCNASHSDVANKKLMSVEVDKNCLPFDQNTNTFVASDFHDENKKQNPFLSAPVQLNYQNESFEHSDFGLQASEPKFQNNKFVLDLAEEIEKSFLIPIKTSTPDGIHGKTGIQVQKDKIFNVTTISNITTINKNCLNITVATPCDNVREENLALDISLYESPIKKKERNLKSSKKLIQVNLFDEVVNSPSHQHNLEDSVLKPKKAYHTPDNFKTHLVRTKRTAEIRKKEIKKSKEDILIQKMTQHFDEVSGTELCIE